MRRDVERPVELLAALIEDEHPRVRLEAVVALSFFPSALAAEIALGALRRPVDRFLRYAVAQLRNELLSSSTVYQDFSEIIGSVEHIDIDSNHVTIALRSDPVLISRIGGQAQQLFISDQDRQRIVDHYRQIADIATTIPSELRAVSLNTFLVPLFTAAHERSQNGSDPIAENRTLFQTLAVYVNELTIEQLLGRELGSEQTPATFIEVRLQRRQDLAQHLVSTAAITVSAGADFAGMLTTTKEAYDARYRSGFSFSDLTANTVGVTLASFATRDRKTALLMQERLASLQDESDYMPAVGSNRDGLSETDFNALYNERSSPEYQRRLRQIQDLIMARPVFRALCRRACLCSFREFPAGNSRTSCRNDEWERLRDHAP